MNVNDKMELVRSAEYVLSRTSPRSINVDVFEWDNIIARSKYERMFRVAHTRDAKAIFGIDDIPTLNKLLSMNLPNGTLLVETHDVYMDSAITRWTNAHFYTLCPVGSADFYHVSFSPKRAIPSVKPISVPLYEGTDILTGEPTLAIPSKRPWGGSLIMNLRGIRGGINLNYLEEPIFDSINVNVITKLVNDAKTEFKFYRCPKCNGVYAFLREAEKKGELIPTECSTCKLKGAE